jgi:ribonucleoside-diphosphate reductase alpha chain
MAEVVRQLEGIGGGRPLGFGPNRVRSLPDGVAQVLRDYMENWKERIAADPCAGKAAQHAGENGGAVHVTEVKPAAPEQPSLLKIGDLCPECGQAAVINEEGCRKCYACGYSEC